GSGGSEGAGEGGTAVPSRPWSGRDPSSSGWRWLRGRACLCSMRRPGKGMPWPRLSLSAGGGRAPGMGTTRSTAARSGRGKWVVRPSLLVARGGFDRGRLEQRLADHHYAHAEHKGEAYLVRAGDGAIAVIDGAILHYGDEAGVKGAIDAHQGGTSIEKNEP